MSTPASATSEVRKRAEALLNNFGTLEAAKELFWDVLGYDRRNGPLSPRLFPPVVRPLVSEATVFAEHEGFCIILARFGAPGF